MSIDDFVRMNFGKPSREPDWQAAARAAMSRPKPWVMPYQRLRERVDAELAAMTPEESTAHERAVLNLKDEMLYGVRYETADGQRIDPQDVSVAKKPEGDSAGEAAVDQGASTK